MMVVRDARGAVEIAALFLLVMALPGPSALAAPQAAEPPAATSPVHLRELYVPYEHFRALTKDDPDGIIMELTEYRKLLRAAIRNIAEAEAAVLPPLDAVVVSAAYRGRLVGETARIDGVLEVQVARDGWVRCDLGAPLPSLGRVLVDGEPGWVVKEGWPSKEAPRASLILQGAGRHRVEIAFSLAVREEEERTLLEGPAVAAACAFLDLEVPGAARGRSSAGFLETTVEGERTLFHLSLGRSERLQLEWQRRKTLGESPGLLAAEHRLSILPRPSSPLFTWEATISIARRKTDTLSFVPPPGTTIVRVEGPLLHAWEPTPEGLRVTLKEAALGDVWIRFSGLYSMAGERFELTPPALRDAYANRGAIALIDPGGGKLEVVSATGLLELDPTTVAMPPVLPPIPAGGEAPERRPPLHLYSFTGRDARLAGRIIDEPLRFEARASYLARIREGDLHLQGFVQVLVRAGRAYELELALPAGWKLSSLSEAAGTAAHGLRHEEIGEGMSRARRILLARAVDAAQPLELELGLTYTPYRPERHWESREVAFGLPALRAAERSRTDLGIALADSIVLGSSELSDWRSLAPAESLKLGLTGRGRESRRHGERLVAGLTTEAATPRVTLSLIHRPARGEYRAVTFLLAAERAYGSSNEQHTVRVRTDLHIAVVDRAIDELVLRHPQLAEEIHVVVLGDGIKEIRPDNGGGTQRVQFLRPWLGTRQLRIEYEIPCTPGEETPLPVIELEGGFGGERFLVLQSQGSVEVESSAGEGLAAVAIDDLPDFGEPWPSGRLLSAFRYRKSGAPGSFQTAVHARAPVLGRLGREMTLTTVIGSDGTSRTLAELLLAYSREQSLEIELPADARCLGVTVNGEPIRALRAGDGAVRAGRRSVAIPLPPRSYATITILYERPDRTRGGGATGLGSFGTWSEEGPRLRGIPVGETTWSIYHPEGIRGFVSGGNLHAVDAGKEARVRSFAASFWGRILTGRLPIFTAFASRGPVRDIAVLPPLTSAERLGAQRAGGGAGAGEGAGAGRVAPRLAAGAQAQARGARAGAPLQLLIPEGRRIDLRKFGGEPRVEIAHRSFGWWRFSRRFMFLGTVLAALLLHLRGRSRTLRRLFAWGLFLGTLVPVALAWESPLLAIPFCEGLVAAAALLGLTRLLGWGWGLVGRRRSRRALPAAQMGALLLAVGAWCALPPGVVLADRDAQNGKGGKAFEAVLIPYSPEAPPWSAAEPEGKAFIPRERFRELWRLAHPEEAKKGEAEEIDLPFAYLLGNADYTLGLEEDRYLLSGVVAVFLLEDDWVALPLPFDRAQLHRVAIDGAEAGVSQTDAGPILALRGRGAHRIEIELAGRVRSHLGEHWIASRLLQGAASTLRALLPPGAEVKASATSAGAAAVKRGDGTEVVIELGGASEARLAWSFPRIEGLLAAQLESTSYSGLSLTRDGLDVRRIERLRVAGRPVERVSYAIQGDWRITEVRGTDVAEWSVLSGEAGGNRPRLTLFFRRPVTEANLEIIGRAVMESAGTMCTLSLEDAVRQESFVGLTHGSGRRFLPDVLGGMRRASRRELSRAIAMPTEELPDRIYQIHGSAAGEQLRIAAVEPRLRLATDAVALLSSERLLIFVRSRYSQAEPGPLRHQVPIGARWRVRRVRSERLRSWELVEGPEGRRLVAAWRDRAVAGTEIVWSAELPFDSLPATLRLPELRFMPEEDGTRLEETVHWVIAAGDELDLVAERTLHHEPIALESAPAWVTLPEESSYRFAWRSRRPDALLEVRPRARSSRLAATIVSFARLGEEFLHVNNRIGFRVRSAGRDRFHLRLPPGAELVSLELQNQRSQVIGTGDDGTDITIELTSPQRGEHEVDLLYRMPAGAGVDDSAPPMVLPIVIFDGERRLAEVDQYVGVVQTERTFTLETRATGLSPVEAETFPLLPEEISPRSLRPSWRATALDWSLTLREQEIEAAEGLDAVIPLADLSTRIGGDGTLRTRVTYTLINERLQFLSVELPEGADLWGVTVNGRPVAVGQESGATGAARTLRIPVDQEGGSELALEVALTYEEPPVDLPGMHAVSRLAAPRIPEEQKVQVVQSIWSVQFPEGYEVAERAGRMRQAPPSLRHAEKLKNLLEQQEVIIEAASGYESRRAQARAARQLARIEQELGDNLAGLRSSNRSPTELMQRALIGKRELGQQWLQNDQIIEETRKAQGRLREELEKGKAQQGAGASRDEQAFRDRANFLRGRAWRGGKQAAQGGDGAVPRGRPGAAGERRKGRSGEPRHSALDGLLEEHAYRGWNALALAAMAPEAETAAPAPIDAKGGLKPLPDAARAGAAPAFKPAEAPEGTTTYTWRRGDAAAELTLSFTRQGTWSRTGAWLLLILVCGGYAWRRWRSQRTGTGYFRARA